MMMTDEEITEAVAKEYGPRDPLPEHSVYGRFEMLPPACWKASVGDAVFQSEDGTISNDPRHGVFIGVVAGFSSKNMEVIVKHPG